MTLLGWTETKLWTLKHGSKSIQTSQILRQRPPKSYKLLKYFMISVILFKMSKHSDFHLIFFQIEGAWKDFIVVTKLIKNSMKTKLYKSPRNYWSIFVSLKRKWPMKKQTPVTAWLTQLTKLTQTNQSTKSASQELKVSHLKITPWPAVIQVSCSFSVYVHTFLRLVF